MDQRIFRPVRPRCGRWQLSLSESLPAHRFAHLPRALVLGASLLVEQCDLVAVRLDVCCPTLRMTTTDSSVVTWSAIEAIQAKKDPWPCG